MPVTHLTTNATGGRPVVMWRRSDLTEGQAALVLGRTPATWLDHPHTARQPLALAEAGYVVLAVDAPNWGNSVDMANIDAVLAWAAGHGAYPDRVPVIGHNRGCLPALNWTLRNAHRVAALCLQSPIMDLAGHWTRNTSDRASMNAAYGGSQATFEAALQAWDPGELHRLWDLHDLVGSPGVGARYLIFRSPGDTQTPVNVTDLLGAVAGAQIGPGSQDPAGNSPSTVIATAVALAVQWEPQAAAAGRMAKWSEFICDAPDFQGYQGGDGSSTVTLPEDTVLDDFPGAARPVTLWFFADSFAGEVDCDTGQYVNGLPLRNVIAVEDANGQLLGQKYGPGTGSAWAPLQPPGFDSVWWWPIDATLDTAGAPVVGCWYVEPGGRWGHLVDTHLVQLDPQSLDVVDHVELGSVGETLFLEQFIEPAPDDPDQMLYVLFQEYTPTYDTYGPGPGDSSVRQRLGRVPRASIYTPGSWRWWTGSGWSASMANAVRLTDDTGAEIRDDATVIRMPDGRYLMAMKRMSEPRMHALTAPAPEGPWHLEGTFLDQADSGEDRYNRETFSYHPKFHAHLSDPTRGEFALTYNTNLYGTDPADPAISLTTFRTRHMSVSLNRVARARPRRRVVGT